MTIKQMIDWLKRQKISTHTLAVIMMTATVMFQTVPPFHDLLMSIYNAMPASLHPIILNLIALYAWYRNGSKPEVK